MPSLTAPRPPGRGAPSRVAATSVPRRAQTSPTADAAGPSRRSAEATPDYRIQLDGLRALAVSAVLFEHLVGLPYPFSRVNVGIIGVRLFFVLSGFLITGILLSCRTVMVQTGQGLGVTLRAFYARRFLRIFPLYYVTLGVCSLLAVPNTLNLLSWHLTYTTNWWVFVAGSYPYPMGHFWSLAVEEQFYLLWPVCILLVPAARILHIILAMVAIGPLSRAVLLLAGASDAALEVNTFSCFEALGMGALLAYAHSAWPRERQDRFAQLLLGVGLPTAVLGLALCVLNEAPAVHKLVTSFGLALVFTFVIHRGATGFPGLMGRFLAAPPMSLVGKISYGIYVYHGPIRVLPLPPMPPLVRLVVCSALSIGVAFVSWHVLELPLNNLKRRFPYRAGPSRTGGRVDP